MAGSRNALIVATNVYEDPKLQMLRAPAEDAEALGHVLHDPEIGDFDVTFSINAKEHELRRTLSTFFADRSRDDVLLLHIGCHGLKDEDGRLYFAAADTELAHLEATSVPAEFVNRRMNDSRSKRIILFLDCCYSGAFASGMTPRADETVGIKQRFEGSGRVVLTASSAMEYSFEGGSRHGSGHQSIFTSTLVQGLQTGEADLDQDHWISVDELYDYVFDRVREKTPHQTPGKWSFVQGDIYVARSSYVAPINQLDLPGELRSMETSALAVTREQLVAELQTLILTRPQFVKSAKDALLRLCADDSRRVSTAAEMALAAVTSKPPVTEPKKRPITLHPADEAGKPPIQQAEPVVDELDSEQPRRPEPSAPPPAATKHSATGIRDMLTSGPLTVATCTAATTAAGIVTGYAAWPMIGESGLSRATTVLTFTLFSALSAFALMLVVLATDRTDCSRARALGLALAFGMVGSAATTAIFWSSRSARWACSGAIIAIASLLPATSWRVIGPAAVLVGGLAALVKWGLLAAFPNPGSESIWVLVNFAAPAALIGAVVGTILTTNTVLLRALSALR